LCIRLSPLEHPGSQPTALHTRKWLFDLETIAIDVILQGYESMFSGTECEGPPIKQRNIFPPFPLTTAVETLALMQTSQQHSTPFAGHSPTVCLPKSRETSFGSASRKRLAFTVAFSCQERPVPLPRSHIFFCDPQYRRELLRYQTANPQLAGSGDFERRKRSSVSKTSAPPPSPADFCDLVCGLHCEVNQEHVGRFTHGASAISVGSKVWRADG
jgi:hypothetical protein